ncbi:MAG: hypothetical protein AAGG46_11055 [Planctomycetota bacterium]
MARLLVVATITTASLVQPMFLLVLVASFAVTWWIVRPPAKPQQPA